MINVRFNYLFPICAFAMLGPANSATNSVNDISTSMGLRAAYEECGDKSGGATVELLNCDAPEYKYQNNRLNAAYKMLMKKLDPGTQSELRNEERKWIAYRDYFCAPDADGGTAADVGSSSCLVSETAKQATALEARPDLPAAMTQYESKLYGIRPAYIKCIQTVPASRENLGSCIAAEYRFQDDRLNAVYTALFSKSSETVKKILVANEKIWIAFRNTHCLAVTTGGSDATDGTSGRHTMAINDCTVEETAKQAFVLEARLSFL